MRPISTLDNLRNMSRNNPLRAIQTLRDDVEMGLNKNVEADDLAEMSLDGSELDLNASLPTEDSTSSEPTETGFTGTFLSVTGKEFDSEVFNIGGVSAGALQWGAKQTDGKLKAGAGAVVLDSDGVSVNVTDTETVTNAYRIIDASGNVIGVVSGFKDSSPDNYNYIALTAKPISGRNPYAAVVASASSGQNATALLSATISGGNFALISLDATTSEILFNATSLKTAAGYISSGSYTPTATNVTNMGTSSGWAANYLRVHNMVTVWGSATIDPTTTATFTEVRITLPIASAMTATSDLTGSMGRHGTATGLGVVVADATNDQALLRWVTDTAGSSLYVFQFSYIIK